MNRGQILNAGLPRWRPGSPWWSPAGAPVSAGIALHVCRLGYPLFSLDHSGLSRSSSGATMVCHVVAPVLTSLPVCRGCIEMFKAPWFAMIALRFYPSSSLFIPVNPGL